MTSATGLNPTTLPPGTDGTSTAEVLAEGLAALLADAQVAQPRAALEAAGQALGLDAADAGELVDELIADGVLIAR